MKLMRIVGYLIRDYYLLLNIQSYRTPPYSQDVFNCRDVECFTLAGYQKIIKGHYRANVPNTSRATPLQAVYVIIFLAVFRLKHKNTDVVISINYPLETEQDVEIVKTGDNQGILRWIESTEEIRRVENMLGDIVSSFEIVEWDLFDAEDNE